MSTAKDRALVRTYLSQGQQPDEIAAALGWPMERVTQVVVELLDEAERDIVNRRPEAWFTEYVMRTHGNMQALDDLDKDLKDSNQGSARVGLINARQKLLTDVIKTGQDLGFIRKRGGGDRLTLVFSGMEDSDLRRVMVDEVRGLRELVTRHGDRDFLADDDRAALSQPVAAATASEAASLPEVAPEPASCDRGRSGDEDEGLAPRTGGVVRKKVMSGVRRKRTLG